ncbi:TIR domain-containing protein [candidate division KSB1 bacterium]|nr:TIR domain-containing protein [candidate division KSB1 bacterium]
MNKIFISYSSKDQDWVRNWLLAQLESNGLHAHIDFRDFEIGQPSLVNMERAVEECAKTLLVLTPNYVQSEFTNFETLMLQVGDPIGLRKRILPLLLVNCELPKHLAIFTYADFRNENERPMQLERLVRQVKKDFTVLEPAKPAYAPLADEHVSLERLPYTGYELFGRQKELQLLDEAWAAAGTHVISFVAYGGVGKSTLLNKWVERLRWDNYRGAQKVFAWSF